MKDALKNFIALAVVLALSNQLFSQAKGEEDCKPIKVEAKKNPGSRGEEAEAFLPGSGKKLADIKPALSRGMSDCLVTLQNQADYEVNVYLDTVWQGSLEPKKTGYISVDAGKYKHLNAISLAGEYTWAGIGDCSCDRTFQLAKQAK